MNTLLFYGPNKFNWPFILGIFEDFLLKHLQIFENKLQKLKMFLLQLFFTLLTLLTLLGTFNLLLCKYKGINNVYSSSFVYVMTCWS